MKSSSGGSRDKPSRLQGLEISLLRKWVVCRRQTILLILFVSVIAIFSFSQLERPGTDISGDHLGSVDGSSIPSSSSPSLKNRLLYIVTTLTEYENGRRQTIKGWNRYEGTMLPVIQEGVESILAGGRFDVDVYVIAHYNMTPERGDRIRQILPDSVGLQVWTDATPLGYRLEERGKNRMTRIGPITRGLARQHRYVIKDKLAYYDVFCIFEDDMLLTWGAVRNYLEMTDELNRLRELAPHSSRQNNGQLPRDGVTENDVFYGIMTKDQLARMMPGFIRVEVLLDEQDRNGRQSELLDPVPMTDRIDLDPSCCRWNGTAILAAKDGGRPIVISPTSDRLLLWETGIRALGIRKLPLKSIIDWVVLQRGPRVAEPRNIIGDYWSGRDHYFEPDSARPDTRDFDYINNQGGWMATRRQILEWHSGRCAGGLVPPYDPPFFPHDGLDTRNVEYWSGGMNLVTSQNGCNLQRVIALDSSRFAKSLLYHTSNNKQMQFGSGPWRNKLVKANDLLGQLNTVKANAEAEMSRRVAAMTQS